MKTGKEQIPADMRSSTTRIPREVRIKTRGGSNSLRRQQTEANQQAALAVQSQYSGNVSDATRGSHLSPVVTRKMSPVGAVEALHPLPN